MESKLIAIADICLYEEIEINFVHALADFGLITTIVVKKTAFLDADELPKLTRFQHLYKDLDINLEGLHAVAHLLNQLEDVQSRVISLENELNYYKQLERPSE
ncbi:chaperone modulatory protein CbpM [Pedobacter sp. UYEF25]